MPRMDKLSHYRTMWTGDNDHGCVRYIRTDIVEWTAVTSNIRLPDFSFCRVPQARQGR